MHGLARVYQRTGEILRSYIRGFSEVRNQIPNILKAEVITYFVCGLYHHDEVRRKFNRKLPALIGEMFQIANQYANAKEAEQRHK